MNVKLLRKIQKHILEVPERFDMSLWHRDFDPGTELSSPAWFDGPDHEFVAPKCGTVCCIGGWAEVLSDSPDACEALCLNNNQAEKLFYNSGWPKKFADRYDKAKTHRSRVRVAVARIDHFIKTKGAE